MKTLDEYINLPYTIELIRQPEGSWFVAVKELPGCMSQGDTPEEAVEMIHDAMRAWIEIAMEDKIPVPEPQTDEEFSGKFITRVPRSLHRQLVQTADQQGVSLNAYCSAVLAQSVGQISFSKKQDNFADLADSMERLLKACQVEILAEQSIEDQFVQWMNSEIEEVGSNFREGRFDDPLEELVFLTRALKKSGKNNSILEMVASLLSYLHQTLTELATQRKVSFGYGKEISIKESVVESGKLSKQQQSIEISSRSKSLIEDFQSIANRRK